jgi:hypothetical protein
MSALPDHTRIPGSADGAGDPSSPARSPGTASVPQDTRFFAIPPSRDVRAATDVVRSTKDSRISAEEHRVFAIKSHRLRLGASGSGLGISQ